MNIYYYDPIDKEIYRWWNYPNDTNCQYYINLALKAKCTVWMAKNNEEIGQRYMRTSFWNKITGYKEKCYFVGWVGKPKSRSVL